MVIQTAWSTVFCNPNFGSQHKFLFPWWILFATGHLNWFLLASCLIVRMLNNSPDQCPEQLWLHKWSYFWHDDFLSGSLPHFWFASRCEPNCLLHIRQANGPPQKMKENHCTWGIHSVTGRVSRMQRFPAWRGHVPKRLRVHDLETSQMPSVWFCYGQHGATQVSQKNEMKRICKISIYQSICDVPTFPHSWNLNLSLVKSPSIKHSKKYITIAETTKNSRMPMTFLRDFFPVGLTAGVKPTSSWCFSRRPIHTATSKLEQLTSGVAQHSPHPPWPWSYG